MGIPISMDANKDSRYKHSFNLRLFGVSAGDAAEASLVSSESDNCRQNAKMKLI